MTHSMQPPAGDDLTHERISTILNGHTREEILAILSEQESVTTLEKLADEVIARQGGKKSNRRKDRSELLTELYHIRLPKLAAVGLLHFDSGQQTIQYREDERVESCLEAVGEEMR